MRLSKYLLSLTIVYGLVSCGQRPLEVVKQQDDNIRLPKAPIQAKLNSNELVEEKLLNPNELIEKKLLNWHQYDLKTDDLFGVSANKTHASFKLTQKREIIVAVIDSGVDIQHEDLKANIWINKAEIPNNGIDDDKNGYVDDVYGWNFIGGSDGSHISDETLEVTRVYKHFLIRLQDGEVLNESEDALFEKTKGIVEKDLQKYTKRLKQVKDQKVDLDKKLLVLKQKLGIKKVDSRKVLEGINSTESEIIKLKEDLLKIWDRYRGGFKRIDRLISIFTYYATVAYNVDFDARSRIVGDDPSDFTDTNYGNNDVTGPDSSHGTHVAGSIAAVRNNGLGMDGIAANVKIMAIRAVPNGDERDKDIALAVKYAADNGAHIINMSFGKSFSPYKEKVDEAFEYAAKKGVLFMHAAGNSSRSVDGGDNNFPNSYKLGSGVLKVNTIPNWIEVGASTKSYGLDLVANFSNYGAEAVTLFSPGHKIYSTTPGSEYAAYSGTSMATPVAAGVAALLMSEFPTMTAKEAKDILFHTVDNQAELDVRKPDEEAKDPDFRMPVPFKSLSQANGVINAFNAMKFAKEE